MVTIDINVDTKEPSPARERSIFALGWVQMKTSLLKKAENEEVRVLGIMVVKDRSTANNSTQDGAA